MVRIILGVIAGFVAWSIIWLGSDQLLINSMGWYAEHQMAFKKALTDKGTFEPLTSVLVMNIVRSVITSLIGGYIAALVAGEYRRSTFWLGLILLLVGVTVEAVAWNYLPIWYHLVFLALLIPMTVIGGKLRRPAPAVVEQPA
jgi:hypothetical protein